jgi:hypothetical protein
MRDVDAIGGGRDEPYNVDAFPAGGLHRLFTPSRARLRRAWASFTEDRANQSDISAADLLLPPLTLVMLILFLFGSVPGASDMIASACATACLP